MTIAMDEFLPDVAAEAYTVPTRMALTELRKAAKDLCRRSNAWRDVQGTGSYTAGTRTYVLTPPTGGVILRTERVVLDAARLLYPVSFDVTPADWKTKQGGVLCFMELSPGVIDLLRVPDADGVFEYAVVCSPADDAASLPDVLFRDHYDTILHGALWRLHAMPEKPWTSATAAVYHQGRFFAGVNQARVDANKLGSADLRVEPRPFV